MENCAKIEYKLGIIKGSSENGKTVFRPNDTITREEMFAVIYNALELEEGNVYLLKDIEEKGYDPLAYRYYCLGSHYRNPLTFTWEGLDGAANAYKKLKSKIKQLDRTPDLNENKTDAYQVRFKEAIKNDLNTSTMMTLVYDVLKDEDLSDFSKLYLMDNFDKVLGLNLIEEEAEVDEDLEKEIQAKIEERNQAKKDKDYAKADQIRNELLEKGIKLIDSREGTTYEII